MPAIHNEGNASRGLLLLSSAIAIVTDLRHCINFAPAGLRNWQNRMVG
jgi:hypothetical protein